MQAIFLLVITLALTSLALGRHLNYYEDHQAIDKRNSGSRNHPVIPPFPGNFGWGWRAPKYPQNEIDDSPPAPDVDLDTLEDNNEQNNNWEELQNENEPEDEEQNNLWDGQEQFDDGINDQEQENDHLTDLGEDWGEHENEVENDERDFEPDVGDFANGNELDLDNGQEQVWDEENNEAQVPNRDDIRNEIDLQGQQPVWDDEREQNQGQEVQPGYWGDVRSGNELDGQVPVWDDENEIKDEVQAHAQPPVSQELNFPEEGRNYGREREKHEKVNLPWYKRIGHFFNKHYNTLKEKVYG